MDFRSNAAHQWRDGKDAQYVIETLSARPLNAPGSANSLRVRPQFNDPRWHPNNCMVTRLVWTLGTIQNVEWGISVRAKWTPRHLSFSEGSGQLLRDRCRG